MNNTSNTTHSSPLFEMSQKSNDLLIDLFFELKNSPAPKIQTTFRDGLFKEYIYEETQLELDSIALLWEMLDENYEGKPQMDSKLRTDTKDGVGITLRQLRIIWDYVKKMSEQQYWKSSGGTLLSLDKVTIGDLERNLVLPVTKSSQRSFTETVQIGYRNEPRWYVTLDSRLPFSDLISCLEQHQKDFSRNYSEDDAKKGGGMTVDTPVWIKSFCMNLRDIGELENQPNIQELKRNKKNRSNIFVIDKKGETFENEEIKAIFQMETDQNMMRRRSSICFYTAYKHELELEHKNGNIEFREAVGIVSSRATSDTEKSQTSLRQQKFPMMLMEKFFDTELSVEHVWSIGITLRSIFIKSPAIVSWLLSNPQKPMDRASIDEYLSRSLKDIRIYNGPAGSDFIRSLTDFIKKCSKLERIIIQDTLTEKNLIKDSDLKCLAKVLKDKQNSIKRLDLWGTDQRLMKILIDEGACNVLFDNTLISSLYKERSTNFSRITFLQRAFLDSSRPVSSMSTDTIESTMNWAMHLEVEDLNKYLETPEGIYLKQILNQQFCRKSVLFVTMLNLYLQITVVCFVSFNTDSITERGRYLKAGVLTGCIVITFFMEALQFGSVTEIKEYITSFKNCIDLAQFGLIVWYLSFESNGPTSSYWTAHLLVSTTAIIWVKLLFNASFLLYPLAIFIAALGEILYELIPFLFTTLIATSMFAHMFQVAERFDCINKEDVSCPGISNLNSTVWTDKTWDGSVISAYTYSVNMILESIIWFSDDSDDDSSGLAYFVMSFYAFTIGILLLNVIIAIVSNAFTSVQDNAERAMWRQRLLLIGEVNSTANVLAHFFKMTPSREMEEGNGKIGIEDPMSISSTHRSLKSCRTTIFNRRPWTQSMHRFDFSTDEIPEEADIQTRKLIDWWRFGNKKNELRTTTRFYLFYKYAPLDQIVLPGKELRKILVGYHSGRYWKFVALIIELLILCGSMVFFFVLFLLGIATFGLLWPTPTKVKFFFIGHESLSDFTNDTSEREHKALEEKKEIISTQNKMLSFQQHMLNEQKGEIEALLKTIDDQKETIRVLEEQTVQKEKNKKCDDQTKKLIGLSKQIYELLEKVNSRNSS